jgi:hypothetical protein
MSWTIRVEGANIQWHTFALQAKDGCYLSANTKLVGYEKAVTLSTESLTRRFREAVLELMRKRHGDKVELVVELGGRKNGTDDVLVEARIAQDVFAPNKRPVI